MLSFWRPSLGTNLKGIMAGTEEGSYCQNVYVSVCVSRCRCASVCLCISVCVSMCRCVSVCLCV